MIAPKRLSRCDKEALLATTPQCQGAWRPTEAVFDFSPAEQRRDKRGAGGKKTFSPKTSTIAGEARHRFPSSLAFRRLISNRKVACVGCDTSSIRGIYDHKRALQNARLRPPVGQICAQTDLLINEVRVRRKNNATVESISCTVNIIPNNGRMDRRACYSTGACPYAKR